MAENADKHSRVHVAKIAGPLLFVAILIVVLVFDPLGHLAQSAWGVLPDLPDLGSLPDLPDFPDIPGWLRFLIGGPGKLIVIAVIAMLLAWGEAERRRRSDRSDGG